MDPVRAYLDSVWSLAVTFGLVTPDSVRKRFEDTIWSRVQLGPEIGVKQGYDEDDVRAMKAACRSRMVELARGDRKPDSTQQMAANQLIPTQNGVSSAIVLDYVKNGHPKNPVVVHYQDKYYIWDGHHRTISDVILGKKPTINVIEF